MEHQLASQAFYGAEQKGEKRSYYTYIGALHGCPQHRIPILILGGFYILSGMYSHVYILFQIRQALLKRSMIESRYRVDAQMLTTGKQKRRHDFF